MAASLNDLAWLWRVSGSMFDARGVRAFARRLKFMGHAARRVEALRPFIRPRAASPLQRMMAIRPETVGAVLWPYQCSNWDAPTRLKRIEEHFEAVRRLGAPFDFPPDEALTAVDLGELSAGLRVVLDQPKWFMREGQLALNLFAGSVRIYTVAFSWGFAAGSIAAFVGAIQGGNTAGIQAEYKDLTKVLHGMRPRDFLVEMFRMLCRSVDVAQIFAVADASRQHRSSYFGAAKASTLTLNYDEIWSERGGVKFDQDFFVLSAQSAARDLEDVPSKKRAMYRRRYEMLDELETRLRATIRSAVSAPLAKSGS